MPTQTLLDYTLIFYEYYISTIQIQIPLTDHDLSEITEETAMKFVS